MAAIEEDITGTTPSADFIPTGAVSIATCSGSGLVTLECKPPLASEYTVVEENFTGAKAVQTPDIAVVYRFRGTAPNVAAHVYLGP